MLAERPAAHAFVRKQMLSNRPPLARIADDIGGRNTDVVIDHFIGFMQAVYQMDGPYRDARRIQRNQKEGYAKLLLGLIRRAGQQKYPVGHMRLGGPELPAIDDPFVALQLSPRRQAREVRPSTGFRITLCPNVLTREHARQMERLLRIRTERHDDWPAHAQAELN